MLGGGTGAAGGAFGSAAAGTSSFDAAAVRRERCAAGVVTEAGAGAAGLGRAARCMRGIGEAWEWCGGRGSSM